MDAPAEEREPAEDTYEIDGDRIVPDASLEPDPGEPGSSEWHSDDD